MKIKKVTVIVAIYKDIEALGIILDSLYTQTYQEDYEVIVAEDGEDKAVKQYIESLKYKNLVHTTQKDKGWQKKKSLNNALRSSSGDLIIFLDGDCIPYNNLIENYVKMAEEKTILCGRRVELGEEFTRKLRSSELTLDTLQKKYLRYYFKLMRDKTRHYEEGVVLSSFLYQLKYKNKTSHILGCNFALNKEDIYAINGFNEDYTTPSVGEDTDIEHRLVLAGCRLKPTRNLTNVIHLYHESQYTPEEHHQSLKVFEKTKERIVCINGIA